MKRKRFSVEHIAAVLKQAKLGLSVAELTRQVGISEQTFYRWKKQLQQNADGYFDIYIGPVAPAGKESNWVQSAPGKGWNTILRLYGPLESWFDKIWKPGDFELVK